MPTMKPYAANTKVKVSDSRDEIESALKKYGGAGFGYMTQGDTALIAFVLEGRHYRMVLTLPSYDAILYEKIDAIKKRRHCTEGEALEAAYEQEVMRRWRALALVIKAKLVAVAEGVRTISEEFLADEVMPNNQRFEEWAEPQIEEMRRRGVMPQLLPGVSPQLNAGHIEGEYCEQQ